MKSRKKSRLQKRREDPNSILWKRKADRLWSKAVASWYGHKCALCGSTEFVQAHHLIPREMYSHRHIVENSIALCPSHHKYSFEISAHRSSAIFYRWFIKTFPEKWEWLQAQTPSKEHKLTFKEAFEKLEQEINNGVWGV